MGRYREVGSREGEQRKDREEVERREEEYEEGRRSSLGGWEG